MKSEPTSTVHLKPACELADDQVAILIEAAKAGMRNAYGVGTDGPRYGAAVLTTNGQVYASGQYKSGTRMLSLHAEHAALVHAAARGGHDISAIAVVSDEDPAGNSFTNPCGVCKQALYESALKSGGNIQIILTNMNGTWVTRSLDELTVYPWPEP